MKYLLVLPMFLFSSGCFAEAWYGYTEEGCKVVTSSLEKFMNSSKECGLIEHDEKNGLAMFLCKHKKGSSIIILTSKTSMCSKLPELQELAKKQVEKNKNK